MPTKFQVIDNGEYQPKLWDVDNPEQHVQMFLWEVDIFNPQKDAYEKTIFCIAPTAEDARCQAESLFKLASYKVTPEEYAAIKKRSLVKQVPFLIRGWGSHLM